MKLWIARDKDGMLYLYEDEPKLAYSNAHYFDAAKSECYDLPIGLFPEVTFENSPKEVELKLVSTGSDRGKRDSIIRGLKQLEHDYMLSYEEEIDG